jgi:hypothetical protein
MNQEIKEKWIAALQSGEYQQGHDYLTSEGKYCCLGVLCDVYRKEMHIGEWGSRGFTIACEYNSAWLPRIVAEWAELECTDQEMLAAHNDPTDTSTTTFSFPKIAELIENFL